MIAGRVADRCIGFVSIAILARLLTPDDFGLIALAGAMVAIVEAIGAFSFDWVLVREEKLDRSKLDTAWTLRLIVDSVLAVLVVLGGFWAAGFYEDPRLQPVAWLLAFALLISATENIGTVYFRREMVLEKEFLLRLTGKLAGFAVTIPVALMLKSYWALLAGILATKATLVAMSYVMHPYRPWFSLERTRSLLSFSLWLQFNSMIDLLRTRLPDFVIARASGTQAVGLYSVANEIANLPSTELIAPINRAVYPGYAKQVVDHGPLAQTFLNVVGLIWTIALPAAAGLAAVAPLIVAILLGQKWLDAIPILRILAIAGAAFVLYTNVSYVFLAIGRPRLTTLMNVVTVSLFVPGLLTLAPRLGPIGAAYAYTATALVMLPISYVSVSILLSLKPAQIIAVTWRPALSAMAMYLVVVSLGEVVLTVGAIRLVPDLLLRIALGMVSYVATLGVLWLASGRPPGAERTIIEFARERLRVVLPGAIP